MSSTIHDMKLLAIYEQLHQLLKKLNRIADDEMVQRGIAEEQKDPDTTA